MRRRRIRRAYLWTALFYSAVLAAISALAVTGPIYAIKMIGYAVGALGLLLGIISLGWMLTHRPHLDGRGRPRR